MNPRVDDHSNHSYNEPSPELTLAEAHPSAPTDDETPFNMSMYIKYLPGTD